MHLNADVRIYMPQIPRASSTLSLTSFSDGADKQLTLMQAHTALAALGSIRNIMLIRQTRSLLAEMLQK